MGRGHSSQEEKNVQNYILVLFGAVYQKQIFELSSKLMLLNLMSVDIFDMGSLNGVFKFCLRTVSWASPVHLRFCDHVPFWRSWSLMTSLDENVDSHILNAGQQLNIHPELFQTEIPSQWWLSVVFYSWCACGLTMIFFPQL